MRYDEAISFLSRREPLGIRLGLGRVRRLLHFLGDPHEKFRSVLIGGTNGKGSVAAMLSSILAEAGIKAGLYTSPHLVSHTERVRIREQDISKRAFSEAVSAVAAVVARHGRKIGRLTTFEVLTVAAFVAFERAGVEIALLEVGLGGRLDATNVVTPLASVITNVDLDHTEILGKTVASIAREKAGIIKRSVPVVTAADGAALEVIKRACLAKGSPLAVAGATVKIRSPLIGRHQARNLSVVLEVVRALKSAGISIGAGALRKGLNKTRWRGRFEIISKRPLVILDGAHNPSGALALRGTLESLPLRRPLTLVLGVLRTKDLAGIVGALVPLADMVIATRSSHPEALPPEVVAASCRRLRTRVRSSSGVRQALAGAMAGGDDQTVIVTGSLFTVADAIKSLTGHRR